MKLAFLLANPSWQPPESFFLGFSLCFKQCKVEGFMGSFTRSDFRKIKAIVTCNAGVQTCMRAEDGKLQSHLEWPYSVVRYSP